ncbi:Arc family DNA-binding protein [Methylorubrum populi]|uniref:Arc family DNA-binding protein n=1 Tax=Methylorubrum populi TaxID=223967 RepID=UPI001154E5D3|nr:Arc family DNA-binding protein [Methylorubrum populi]QDI82365.1 Arc family DNA-binding protein [Methylorubrum populi]
MSKPPAPSDIADKFMLRMPEGMRDRLKTAAEENNRSMNAEIIARLQVSLDASKSATEKQLQEMGHITALTIIDILNIIMNSGDNNREEIIGRFFRDYVAKVKESKPESDLLKFMIENASKTPS